MTTYPASIDNSSTLPTAVDNSTPVQGAVVNRLRDAILAIEAELGVKPSSVYGTVRARLDALEGIIGNLQIIELNGDLGGTLEEPLVIGIQGRPVSSVAPVNGQSLVWNGIAWAPRTISGGGGGGTQDLFTTLSLGNVTDGYNIIISSGDNIRGQDGEIGHVNGYNLDILGGFPSGGGTPGKVNINESILVDDAGLVEFQQGSNLEFKDISGPNSVIKRDGLNLSIDSGGSGNITLLSVMDMSSHKIINVTDPTDPQDAATKFYVDNSGGGSFRDLTNAVYVDVGGDGYGNIEDPLGTVTEALGDDYNAKFVIIAPGDYSGESAVPVASNRKYYISGMNYPGVGSPFEGNFITLLPALVMPTVGGEQGAMAFSNLNLTSGISVGSSTTIRNCVNVSVNPTTDNEGTFLEVADSHIAALDVAGLNAIGCTFAENIGISVSGTIATIISSQFSGAPSLFFTGSPGILYIDNVSNYTNITVINGSKVIMGPSDFIQVDVTAGDSPYTIPSNGKYLVTVETTESPVTIIFPDPVAGDYFIIKDGLGGAASNNITIQHTGYYADQFLDTNTISTAWQALHFVWDTNNSAYTMIASFGTSSGTPTLNSVLSAGNSASGFKIINLLNPTSNQDAATKFYVDGYFFGGDGYGTGNPNGGNIAVTTLAAGHPAGRYAITAYAEIVTAPSAGTVDASIGYTSAALGAKTMEMFPNPQSLTPTGPLNWFSTTIYSNGTAAIIVTFTMASVTGSGRIDCYTAARKF